MQIGMVGLGRMGANMVERLVSAGHEIVGYDRAESALSHLARVGATAAGSLESLVSQLRTPRVVWLMLPAGDVVDHTVERLSALLESRDVLIDGGNSNYRDTIRRANLVRSRRIEFVDVGTSGGIWGRTEGYSLMIGGEPGIIARLVPLFRALAPAPDRGWAHVGS